MIATIATTDLAVVTGGTDARTLMIRNAKKQLRGFSNTLSPVKRQGFWNMQHAIDQSVAAAMRLRETMTAVHP